MTWDTQPHGGLACVESPKWSPSRSPDGSADTAPATASAHDPWPSTRRADPSSEQMQKVAWAVFLGATTPRLLAHEWNIYQALAAELLGKACSCRLIVRIGVGRYRWRTNHPEGFLPERGSDMPTPLPEPPAADEGMPVIVVHRFTPTHPLRKHLIPRTTRCP